MTATLLILSLLSSAVPQPGLPVFLARRDYDSAVQYYRARLLGNAADVEDMRNLARVYDHWHKFDSSLAWWNRVLEQNPNDDSAIVGRWSALYRRDEKDTTRFAATRLLIRDEASKYLYEETARYLTLLYDGMSLADSAIAERSAWLLAERFPDSPRAYEVTGNLFYDSLNPVWTNDTLKVPLIHRFLARLPKTEWRQTFYMFMLSSRFGLKDTAGLRADAAEMVADDTLDPFRYRYAAALFNRLKYDPKTAEAYARKSIALEPTAKRSPNKPQEQWDIEYPSLRGSALLALAEALKLQGKLAPAESSITEAISEFRWDTQQEATPGPFYCLLGEIKEAEADTSAALASYVQAIEAGDSRNYWAPRADSGFKRLSPVTDREELGFGRTRLYYRGPAFTDVTDSFGLKDRHESRVAWGDYNNDGYQDLLLNGCVLFRNDSGRGFTNVTDSAGLSKANGRGGLFADFNNDGWLDLYVAAGEGGARFYKNDSGRFVNLSDRAGGPGNASPTEGAGFADFDNDGRVDLYCANYENWEKHIYYPDQLFQNQRGYFADVTRKAGIIPPYGIDLAGRGVNWGDYNNDGYQDCYVSNYRLCENLLWVNNHDSTFTNMAPQLGVAGDEVNGYYGHTIGSEWGDYDNDGDLDLFCGNLAHPRYIEFSNRSMLYENQLLPSTPHSRLPTPLFVDRRAASGIRYEETHSDPAWADVDNDGYLDLYITSIYEGRRSFLYQNTEPPLATRNSQPATRRFVDITWLSGTRVFNGWGCAFADFDNDGDEDLVVGSGSGVKLFRNDTRNGNNWLEVRVIGKRANRAGIGARVTVTQGESHQIREVEGGKGTMSQNSLVQHFGFGHVDTPVTVEVRFGPKSKVVLNDVKPDQLITVEEKQEGEKREKEEEGKEEKESRRLFPITGDGGYGYCDRSGRVVIKPQFGFAARFSEGLARVKVGDRETGRWGYIDEAGKVVIKPQFDMLGDFHEGLATVEVGGKSGYIDKTGKYVINPQFDGGAGDFSEGLASVWMMDGKSGYIDKTGNMVIRVQFSLFEGGFSEGLAAVQVGVKFGYIDRTGDLVIEPKFDLAGRFSEGLAMVKDLRGSLSILGRRGYIDRQGRIVIPPQFDWAEDFSEGLAAVRIGKKWGYIDKTGRYAISPRLDDAESFYEGLARVSLDGIGWYIDKTGKAVWKSSRWE